MQIYVRTKALGKRRDVLEPVPYNIPDAVASLRQLLTAIVLAEVERYNIQRTQGQLIPYLTAQDIDEQTVAGKVSFGTIFSEKGADKEKAVRTVLHAWEDGLVRVIMDDNELTELDAPLSVPENAVFTFIRLAFLAGRMW